MLKKTILFKLQKFIERQNLVKIIGFKVFGQTPEYLLTSCSGQDKLYFILNVIF